MSQGAAQDNLSLEKLLSFKLNVALFDEQKRIADVITAYDELMENNRRRMALLEEAGAAAICGMVRALALPRPRPHSPR